VHSPLEGAIIHVKLYGAIFLQLHSNETISLQMVHLGRGAGWTLVYYFLLLCQHRRRRLYFEVPVLAVVLLGMTRLTPAPVSRT
jgi:hypothetical protein